MRRQVLALATMTCLSLMTTGCAIRQSADDLAVQEQEKIDTDYPPRRPAPTDLTPYRIHGGVGPASDSI